MMKRKIKDHSKRKYLTKNDLKEGKE